MTNVLLQMRLQGFCVLDQIVPQDRCAELRKRIKTVVRSESDNYASPDCVGFVPGVINHDLSFAEYLAEPRLLELARALLGHGLRISFTSAIINEPGNERGKWHADWPFNQNNAGHIPVPYPDAVMHLTTLWMLSPFSTDNGGTLVVPGSHRLQTNPTAADCALRPGETTRAETRIEGAEGSVLVMDSRLWHATAPNQTDESRVALAVRYAPWWLNTEVLRPGSPERNRLVDETGKGDNQVPSLRPAVFEQLPEAVKPLYRHWVAKE